MKRGSFSPVWVLLFLLCIPPLIFGQGITRLSSSQSTGIQPLNAGLTEDGTYSGQTASITAGEAVLFGDVLVKKADGEYYKTDADATSTMPAMVVALEGKGDGEACVVLIRGWVCETDWNWTVGDGQANLLYPDDAAAGGLVQHAGKPGDTGDQLQVVGYAESADCIYFNPSYVLVEVK